MKKLQWGQGLVLGAFGWMRCRALADRPSSHITKGITRSPHHLLINLKAPWAWQALCAAALQLILLMPSAAQAATPMISAGSRHSMALKSDGTVVVWGDNLYGQSTIPPGLTDVVSVAAGSLHSLALKADGTVAAWGWNDYGQTTVPAGLSGVIRVSAGSSHSMALKSDGTVVAWGGLYSGSSSFQVPIAPPSGLSNVVAISAGSGHSLALKSDGSVAAWGYSTFGQNTIPSGLSNVTQVSDEGTYSMSLKADGTVVAWGISSYVRTAFLATLSNVASVSAGELHALALKTDGTVVAWGSNSSYYTICCGVTSSFYTGQSVVPPGLNNVVAISAGGRHSLALKADGTVVAWGSNSHANSGIPTTFTQTGESSVPVGLNLNPQKTSQTIVFHIAPTLVQGGDVAVSATASSGLPVIFSSITNNTCTISGSTVTGITAGTCTIAANQAGNTTYSAAPQVTQNITVSATARLINLSTRGQVQTGDNVMIGGFIIGGTTPKKVLVRAVGPNLANYGVSGVLLDPSLQLFSGQTAIASNDDWGSASNVAEIQASTFAPVNAKESAILSTLNPGAYTAIVSGMSGGTGVGIVEVYELDHPEIPLINISTRGKVLTGDNVMIGGFIIQGDSAKTVLIRAVGPNLANYGVIGVLANPKLQLYSGQTVIASNDDWGTATNAADITATGLAPVSPLESAILITLQPGAYTAIVSGADGGSGVGIVEVFAQ